jgi:GntR family transcriptional regulator
VNSTAKICASKAKKVRKRLKPVEGASLPVYHQLYAILRQQIKDGAFDGAEPLPPEMALCETYKVSRVSVRRALKMLETEGLVVRRHGVGTFAASTGGASAPRIGGLIDNLITLGLETTAKLLVFEADAVLPGFASAALNMQPESRGTHIERLRFYKGKPLSLTNIYLPSRLSALIRRADIDDRPVIRILEAAGLRAMTAEQTISAVVADADTANKLRVGVGSPLIRMQKTVFDRDGVAFEYQRGLYNPDHYEYHMMLTRDSSTRPQWRNIA